MAALPVLFGTGQQYAHACEVEHGFRVIDLAFVEAPDPRLSLEDWKHFARAFSCISSAQQQMLAIIWREQRVTLASLSSMTWMPREDVWADYLLPFLDSDLIRRSGPRSYEPTEWSEWRPCPVVTVEAKLSDWRCALAQATDNKKRSDFSYVAFPSGGLAQRDVVHREASRLGIGVIEVSPTTQPMIILKAKRVREKKSPERWTFLLSILADLVCSKHKWCMQAFPGAGVADASV